MFASGQKVAGGEPAARLRHQLQTLLGAGWCVCGQASRACWLVPTNAFATLASFLQLPTHTLERACRQGLGALHPRFPPVPSRARGPLQQVRHRHLRSIAEPSCSRWQHTSWLLCPEQPPTHPPAPIHSLPPHAGEHEASGVAKVKEGIKGALGLSK